MAPIVTDVERVHNHSTPRSPRSARALQRVGIPALTVVTVLSSTVFGLARPAAGDAISDAKAKAAAIEAQLSQAQNEMSALSQQYDAARYHLSQINSSIDTTKANIAADQAQVAHDRATLSKAAVANYISDGSAAAQNPIFSGNETTLGATTVYNKITQGDIALAVDNLHTAENSLNAQVAQLQGEQTQAQTQVTIEQNAVAQNAQAVQQQKSALAQEQGQIAQLVQQQQQAEAAAAAKAAAERQQAAAAAAAAAAATPPRRARAAAPSAWPGSARRHRLPPPRAARAPCRRRRARSASPTSGAASPPRAPPIPGSTAPVSPPGRGARSGSACRTTRGPRWPTRTPVPISDLQPGDLLFYGPGGSDHVAMYVGGGQMIEAPYTGASVWITGLRLGSGFAGAGRP